MTVNLPASLASLYYSMFPVPIWGSERYKYAGPRLAKHNDRWISDSGYRGLRVQLG